VARRLAEKMKGMPLSLLPEAAFNAFTTAHILGGCCMGESQDKGGVGFNGEVFGHPNLFVAGGSVVPANLRVNPSLTISALSEFIMSQLPGKKEKDYFAESQSTLEVETSAQQLNRPGAIRILPS
jgi:cholesterol oxidase